MSDIRKNKNLGEYDPPYDFSSKPTEEQIEIAKKIIEKYEKLASEKKRENQNKE